MTESLIVGSRSSVLALRQTEQVIAALHLRHPSLSISIKKIRTQGDEMANTPLSSFGGKGVFIKELESALLAHEIDVAVHSLKDMPTELTPGLQITAVTTREDARDALVSRDSLPLLKLPRKASLGTGSLRRASQLKRARPDIEIRDIRGNLDTRLRKVSEGQYDAAVVAAAGLIRMGWQERIVEYLPLEVCLPAVSQGALAIETRVDDKEVLALVSSLEHRPTRLAVTAERSFLQRLGGGCQMPIACYAESKGAVLHLDGMVATPLGERMLRHHMEGDTSQAEQLGQVLAETLLSQGAGDILGIPAGELP